MQRALSIFLAAATGAALASVSVGGLGCAAPVEVQRDPSVDFSQYRGWNWVEGSGFVLSVPEPERDLVRRRLARLVEENLAGRGFQRVSESPDLCVGMLLAARQSRRIVQETGANESLTSHHESSFQIQASEARVEKVRTLRLELYAADCRRGNIVWQSRLTRSTTAPDEGVLDELVEELLAEFPEQRGVS